MSEHVAGLTRIEVHLVDGAQMHLSQVPDYPDLVGRNIENALSHDRPLVLRGNAGDQLIIPACTVKYVVIRPEPLGKE